MATISARSTFSRNWTWGLAVAALATQAGCSAPVDGQEGADPAEASLGSSEQALVGCQSTALQRVSATASSVESGSFGANLAIDGNPATRWSSAFADPQWLRVDLGAIRLI